MSVDDHPGWGNVIIAMYSYRHYVQKEYMALSRRVQNRCDIDVSRHREETNASMIYSSTNSRLRYSSPLIRSRYPRTFETKVSVSYPKYLYAAFPGKLCPKRVKQMPASAYRSHPFGAYGSMTTAGIPRCRFNVFRLYSTVCLSKRRWHGKLTTRATILCFFFSSFAASNAKDSSAPTPINVISALPSAGSSRTYAPNFTPSRRVCLSCGTAWREVEMIVDVFFASMAVIHAPAVSSLSLGRMYSRFGMARKRAAFSIGWCVGPSSPMPIESWVAAWMTCSRCKAPMRTAGAAYR